MSNDESETPLKDARKEWECAATTFVSLLTAASTGYHFCPGIKMSLIGGKDQCKYCHTAP